MIKSNALSVVSALLTKYKISHTIISLRNKLESHPDYPSLLSVSDSLTDWNIPNRARKVALSFVTSNQIALPFIAHLNYDTGRFILVTAVAEKHITYIDERKEQLTLPVNEFSSLWSGIILEAGKGVNSSQPDYHNARYVEILDKVKLPLLLVVLGCMFLLKLSSSQFNLGISLLLTLKILGTMVTSALLMQGFKGHHPFFQALCGSGPKNGCESILRSESAKITSWLSWSEVGFFYFSGTLLALMWSPPSYNLLIWLNLIGLPYILYSIGYQFFNNKWCKLCCLVQVILALEAIVGINTLTYNFDFSYQSVLIVGCAIALVALMWYTFKPLYYQSEELRLTKEQLKTLKFNPLLFNHSLKSQPRYAVNDELVPIVFGNRDAQTIITMVSNPFCRPCSKSHQMLNQWLQQRNDIQLKIVFNTLNEDEDERTIVARHLVALKQKSSPEILEKALNDWYNQSQRNYEVWAKKYPVENDLSVNLITGRQKEWCEMAEITHTPTFLIDGYKMPKHYKLEDIRYLIA